MTREHALDLAVRLAFGPIGIKDARDFWASGRHDDAVFVWPGCVERIREIFKDLMRENAAKPSMTAAEAYLSLVYAFA